MQRHWLFVILSVGFFATMLGAMLAASTIPSAAQEDFIIVSYSDVTGSTDIPTRQDPALAETSAEFTYLANVLMTLVRVDPEDPSRILPGLAATWEISDDQLEYTFSLDTSIAWVSYDPESGVVLTHRNLHALDVVYSMYRVCDSRTNSRFAVEVLGPVIKGCEQSLAGRNPEDVLGVALINNATVRFTLTQPNASFLYLLTSYTTAPIPPESVDSQDVAWGPGTVFWSNGPFIPTPLGWLRNPNYPESKGGFSNIDLVTFPTSPSAPTEVQSIERPTTGLVSIRLDTSRAPLNNVHVRRALYASLDRAAIVEDGFVPINHIAPLPLSGGLADDAVGVGYDLAFARDELQAAGYPNCDGMPPIVHTDIPAAIIDQWLALGCSADQFVGWTDGSTAPPHMAYTVTAQADFNDVESYISLIACEPLRQRPCSGADILINRARAATSDRQRASLIAPIMNLLFGPTGDVPIIPIARPIDTVTVAAWLEGPIATNGAASPVRLDYFYVAPERAPATVYGDGSLIFTGSAQGRISRGPATPSFLRYPTPVLPPFDRTIADTCYLQSLYSYLNIRSSPYSGPVIRILDYGEIVQGIAYYTIPNSFRYWWQLEGGGWVRDNWVAETQGCFDVLPFNR